MNGGMSDTEELRRLRVESRWWRVAWQRWQHWADELLDELGRQPLHGQHGSDSAREVIGQLARMAPPVPRCSRCGCFVTRHEVDDEDRRECADCECTQFEVDEC